MRMNPTRQLITSLTALLGAIPLAAPATVFFSDTFGTGSSFNSLSPAAPTDTNTSYQVISSKSWVPAPSMASGHFQFGIASSTGGTIETQARFGNSPVSLVLPNDYVELSFTFINATNLLTASSGLGFGLYNSGGVSPVAGGLNGTAVDSNPSNASGGAAGWKGYVSVIQYTGSASRLMDRLPQTGAGNNNQDLVTVGSSSQSYRNPTPASLSGSQVNGPSTTLTSGSQYTATLRYTLTSSNTLAVDSRLYTGANTSGTLISSNSSVTASPPNTAAFDAFAIGWRAQAATTGGTIIDLNSIKVEGAVTLISTPPDILTQPVSVTVPSGASCAFSVAAQGFGMTYQWKRYGTNLVNGGNLSGATSEMLVLSPASSADAAAGGNGYSVTISGAGGYTTNSQLASLSLGTAKTLVWSGTGNSWDLGVNANWLNGASPATFNYGDTVTFNDTGLANMTVSLNGAYLSAASVIVDSGGGIDYIFDGSGSFAGPGNLVYQGAGLLTIKNANTYSGGTTINNASAYLVLNNYNGLGSGPVTLAKAGGTMEIVPAGNASTGIRGDLNIQDDFTIQFDGSGAFATVFLGALTGASGKTLNLTPSSANLSATNRIRVYGTNASCDANLVINGNATAYALANGTVLSPYQTGSQTYGGVISGNGGLLQRGTGTTILSGQNIYTGGTYPAQGTIAFGANSTPTTGPVTSGPIGTGPLLITYEIGSAPSSGTVLAFGGPRTIANDLGYPSTTNTQTLIIGGTNALTFTGSFSLDGFDGTVTATNRTIQVNNTNAITTIAGVISGASQFTKTGNGTLDLTATETYSGATAINAGTLRVNGALAAASAITVATNATLAGAGTINGPVTVAVGGSIAPGNDAIGTLTVNNNLTLSGKLAVEVNRTGSSSDRINVSGTLNNAGSGSVTVANLGAALQAGDTFTLFNKALANGSALTVSGASAVWTNKLAVDGTIAVVTPIATTATNITASLSGNSLTLSWPLDHLTWILQSNSVSLSATTNWYPITGSANVTQQVITVDPAKANVFYRLIAP